MSSPESIVLTWEEWKASRAAKRALLEKMGMAAPSRRQVAIGSQEKRLRKAFDGRRAPEFLGDVHAQECAHARRA